jgi:hypothetical protein
MDATYQHASETKVQTKTSQPAVSSEGKISKQALLTFLSGAVIVFAIAIYYCVETGYAEVGGILAGAFALICIFASVAYRSFR